MLDSEAFGPLCAELRRAEANGINPEQALPRLVGARSLAGAVDVASVMHGRLAQYIDSMTVDRRVRTWQRANHVTGDRRCRERPPTRLREPLVQ